MEMNSSKHCAPSARELGALGGPMDGGYEHVSNGDLPAGYTYFAQFVLHDLTFDRIPRLDLSGLYGRGPGGSLNLHGRSELLPEGISLGFGVLPDLARDSTGRALIADSRNDFTIMVGQVQALFTRLHNVCVAEQQGANAPSIFVEARRQVTYQYQALIVDDVLRRLVDEEIIERQVEAWRHRPPLTVLSPEFSLAAGRFGHAMVKPRYRLNDNYDGPVYRPEPLPRRLNDLRGQPLEADIALRWENFFPIGHPMKTQSAARINTLICRPLFEVPFLSGCDALERSIPYRTLIAGEQAGLASGQDTARALHVERLSEPELWGDATHWFGRPAPLWYYILKEADVTQHGRRLGSVGGTLFADMIIGALMAEPDSILRQGTFRPTAHFADLLRRLALH